MIDIHFSAMYAARIPVAGAMRPAQGFRTLSNVSNTLDKCQIIQYNRIKPLI